MITYAYARVVEVAMKWFARSLTLSLLVVSFAPAFAKDLHTETTKITMIFTGFEKDQFGIHTAAKTVNPAKCKLSDQGYATDSSEPGYYTFYAAALLAFAERADVVVVVDDEGCVADRPKLIGLNIMPAK
jgi:hypothetical protein